MELYLQILVAILSTTLAIFLLQSILLLVQIRKLVQKVDAVTDKAGDLVESVAHVGDTFQRLGGPLAVWGFVSEKFRQKKGKRK